MKTVHIRNLSRPLQQPLLGKYGDSFWARFRGLMLQRSLPQGECLILVQPRDSKVDASIHMMFMYMDLAVAWVNQAGEVVDICLARRWKAAYFPKQPARYVLEMHPDRLADFQIGDKVKFEEV
jgi:uncharacterized membrane protein (UPF0127 family)